MRLRKAKEHLEAMNFITAKKLSAEGIANCDSCGTAASNLFVEWHTPNRPARQDSDAACLPLWSAIVTHSIIFLCLHRIFHSSLRVSTARPMRGASAKKTGMLAHSMRNLRSEGRSAESLRPGVGNPDYRESSSVRSLPRMNSKDPLGIILPPKLDGEGSAMRAGHSETQDLDKLHRPLISDRRSLLA